MSIVLKTEYRNYMHQKKQTIHHKVAIVYTGVFTMQIVLNTVVKLHAPKQAKQCTTK